MSKNSFEVVVLDWANGYFSGTVGRHGDEDTIRNYVKGQGQAYQKLHEDKHLALF
jgi:putative transposase